MSSISQACISLSDKLSSLVLSKRDQKILVLIYHQVFKERNPYFPNEPDIRVFDEQMAIVSKHFNVVLLGDGLKQLELGTLPAKSIAITFDDGYQNCRKNAVPILKKYQLPATLFIPTDAMEEGVMWNDKLFQIIHKTQVKNLKLDKTSYDLSTVTNKIVAFHRLNSELKFMLPDDRNDFIAQLSQQLGVDTFKRVIMSPDEIADIKSDTLEIGSHSKTHPIFSMLDTQSAEFEFLNSHEKLSEVIHDDVRGFAYPNGKYIRDFNDETLATISKTPYKYAVTTNWGIVTAETCHHRIPRFTPWDNTPFKFYLRLLSKFVFPPSVVNKDVSNS